jgi:hypothetical protein
MSKANYAPCEGCGDKAFYVGEGGLPDGIVIWHEACLAKSRRAEPDQFSDSGINWTAIRDHVERLIADDVHAILAAPGEILWVDVPTPYQKAIQALAGITLRHLTQETKEVR